MELVFSKSMPAAPRAYLLQKQLYSLVHVNSRSRSTPGACLQHEHVYDCRCMSIPEAFLLREHVYFRGRSTAGACLLQQHVNYSWSTKNPLEF
ncbi:unnamed protein product, partial [Nesidiocoris tenuis]